MSVRKIEFLVSTDSVAPDTVVCGGRQYEHNATQIDFVIDDDLYELLSKHQELGKLVFRIDVINGEGGYIPLGSVEPINIDGKIVLSYKIGYEITSVGGRCKFTIVASCIDEQSNREEMIFCSADVIVEFDAVSRNDGEHTEFEKGLSSILNEAKGCLIETAYIQDDGMFCIKYVNGRTVYVGISNLLSADRIQDAVKATKAADTATENAINATNSANEAANDARNVRAGIEAGGFIESLKELNAGGKFSFWVGTKAEYEEIPENERVQNCFYLVTDDTTTDKIKATVDYIVEQGTKTINYYNNNNDGFSTTSATWYYELWNSGKAVCWAILEATYTTDTASILKAKTPYPIDFINKPIVLATLCSGNNPSDLSLNLKYQHLLDIDGVQLCVHNPNAQFTEESIAKISVELKGNWK